MSNLIPIKIAELALEVKDKENARLKADLKNCRIAIRVKEAENARLKAEVDRLAQCEGYHYTAIAISMLKEQLQQKNIDYVEARKANEAKVEMIKSLKAEVERLSITEQNQTDRVISLEDCIEVLKQDRDGLLYEETERVKRLKAEVDDLRLENQAFQRTVNEASAHYDNRLADISRLKGEVERLTAFTTRTIIPNEELQAQVEELELEVLAFDRTIKQASCHYDNRLEDIRQLQAQVERLTKENETRQRDMNLMFQEIKKGREAYQRLHYLYLTAKEGKQP